MRMILMIVTSQNQGLFCACAILFSARFCLEGEGTCRALTACGQNQRRAAFIWPTRQKFAGVFALMISASSWPMLRKLWGKVVGK